MASYLMGSLVSGKYYRIYRDMEGNNDALRKCDDVRLLFMVIFIHY